MRSLGCVALLTRAALLASTCLGFPAVGVAAGLGVSEASATGLGMAFAGAAAGGAGLDSILWNPAALALNPGSITSLTVSGVRNVSRIDPDATKNAVAPSGDMAGDGAAFRAAQSVQVSERIWFGLTADQPYQVLQRPPSDPFRYNSVLETRLDSVRAAALVAYRATDWLALGAGVQGDVLQLASSTERQPVPASYVSRSDTRGYGLGFVLGAQLTPFAGTSIGVGYRSRVSATMKGDQTFQAYHYGVIQQRVEETLTLPEVATFGVRQRIGGFNLLAGAEWTRWSVTQPIGFAQWRDSYRVSVGGEVEVTRALTLRSGVGFERSAVSGEARGVRFPETDQLLMSLGLSYRMAPGALVTLGYTHTFSRDGKLAVNSANPVTQPFGSSFYGVAKASADMLALGFAYQWSDRAL